MMCFSRDEERLIQLVTPGSFAVDTILCSFALCSLRQIILLGNESWSSL